MTSLIRFNDGQQKYQYGAWLTCRNICTSVDHGLAFTKIENIYFYEVVMDSSNQRSEANCFRDILREIYGPNIVWFPNCVKPLLQRYLNWLGRHDRTQILLFAAWDILSFRTMTEAARMNREDRLERTMSMAHNKGLLNLPGENNCFLNSAVQVSLLAWCTIKLHVRQNENLIVKIFRIKFSNTGIYRKEW